MTESTPGRASAYFWRSRTDASNFTGQLPPSREGSALQSALSGACFSSAASAGRATCADSRSWVTTGAEGDVAERMIEAKGVALCREAFGAPRAPPILLIMGIGASMLWWEEGFCRMLADGG